MRESEALRLLHRMFEPLPGNRPIPPTHAFELLQMLTERILAIEKSLKKSMDGLVPICANCKKIRESVNTWTSIEAYISDRSDSEFSHSICPACAKALYPDLHTDP